MTKVHPARAGETQHPLAPPDVHGVHPARAGETLSPRVSVSLYAVHPRACGGNTCFPPTRCVCQGPSPRVRGKPSEQLLDAAPHRSIPARAGETPARWSCRRSCPVHPRACGGNGGGSGFGAIFTGPSPRVRGKLTDAPCGSGISGSIPARAGETVCRFRVRSMCEVHPRACGETLDDDNTVLMDQVHPRACGGNRAGLHHAASQDGPSPRVRGKPSRRA